MEGGNEFRPWDELIPDALGIIFCNLSLEEKLTVIPSVCKSWDKVVRGPYCWQDIDIEDWSLRCNSPGNVERMLQMLMNRSCGSLRTLRVANLRDDMIFSSIAEKAGSLQTLRLRRCEMSDSTVQQIAEKLSSITFLDLNSCGKIGSRALEAIGKNCKSLVGLCWNNHNHPIITERMYPRDAEARAIAKTMPGIKHLEMTYNLMSRGGVLHILTSCRELEFLNLRGCWYVKLDRKYLAEKFPKLKLLGPEPGPLDYDWNNPECSKDASEDRGLEDMLKDNGIHQDEVPPPFTCLHFLICGMLLVLSVLLLLFDLYILYACLYVGECQLPPIAYPILQSILMVKYL